MGKEYYNVILMDIQMSDMDGIEATKKIRSMDEPINKIPIIALNAPRELIRALAESEFDDLPDDLKAQLPGSYDWSDKDYENRLRDIFELSQAYDLYLKGQFHWGKLTPGYRDGAELF